MEKKGRPLIFNNAEELEKRIQEYWEYCEEREKPYTISGLAYYLNTTRQTIFNYSRRDEFASIIERAALNLIIKENKWIEFAESLIIQSESGGC